MNRIRGLDLFSFRLLLVPIHSGCHWSLIGRVAKAAKVCHHFYFLTGAKFLAFFQIFSNQPFYIFLLFILMAQRTLQELRMLSNVSLNCQNCQICNQCQKTVGLFCFCICFNEVRKKFQKGLKMFQKCFKKVPKRFPSQVSRF